MSVPWVNGTVLSVLLDLRKTYAISGFTNTGLVYAAAIGMITGIVGEEDLSRRYPSVYGPVRPLSERMADIATVCTAIHQFEDEQAGQ